MAWDKDEVDRTLAEIVRRAQHDQEFRRLCLATPHAAVALVAGQAVPADFRLRFVDNDHADLVVVLPDPVATGELRDEDLSAVSAGTQAFNQTGVSIGGTCFAAGTPVLMANGTWQPIETIGPGAQVRAFDEPSDTVVTAPVTELLDHAPQPIFRAVVEGLERGLLVTANHPFYVDGRWRQIGTLPVPARLFHFDAGRGLSSARRLLALEPTGLHAPVFNFEVGEAHSYFVDGLLVHNGKVTGSLRLK